MKKTQFIFWSVILSFFAFQSHAQITPDPQGIVYVKPGGNGNGSSWASATNNLQGAINASGATQVWVAQGIYIPPANGYFYMRHGVSIFGSFPNSGTPTRNDRDINAHQSVLRGNGSSVIFNLLNNLTHTDTIDGFVITNGVGYPNGGERYGGGIFNYGSSPTVSNVALYQNSAHYGGGMFNQDCSPNIHNSSFLNNLSLFGGGMFYLGNNSGNINFYRCLFSDNTSYLGGAGIYVSEPGFSVQLHSCAFSNNTALSPDLKSGSGGALLLAEGATANASNTIFVENKANGTDDDGGGALIIYGNSKANFQNVTFYNNSTLSSSLSDGNSIVGASQATLNLYNSIVYGKDSKQIMMFGTTDYQHSNLQGLGNLSNGNLDEYPGFLDTTNIAGIDGQLGSEDDGLSLAATSSAINAGNNSYYTGNLSSTEDFAKKSRVYDLANGGIIDMGAYEYQGHPSANLPDSAYSNGPVCEGATLRLYAQGGVSYSWTGPNGFTSNLQNPIIPNVDMNHYGIYRVTITDQNSNTITKTMPIVILLKPNIQTNVNSPICAGDVLYLQATGGMIYEWIGPNGFTSNIPSPAIYNITPAAAGVYKVKASNTYCTDSAEITVVVNTPQGISATSNSPVCEGSAIRLQSSGGTSYQWTGPYGFTANAQNPFIVNAASYHAGTYSVKATDNNGCSETKTVQVSTNPKPTITATSNTPICEGQDIELQSSGAISYSWTGPNNFTSTLQNPSISNALTNSSGIYMVSGEDANGCIGTANVNVVVSPKPNMSITSNSPICAGQTLSLRATGGTSYHWTGPNNFTASQNNVDINNITTQGAGVYTVAIDNGNCVDTAKVTVNVTPGPSISVQANNNTLCQGSTLNLQATGASSYYWTGPNNFTSTLSNPSITNITNNASGKYKVVATANNCTSMDSLEINVVNNPNPSVSHNSPICEGSTLNLSASGGTSFSWSGPNNFSSTQQNPSIPNASVNADGVYSLTAYGINNCSTSVNINVVVNTKPNVQLSSNAPICEGQTLNLNASGGYNYFWSGPNNFSARVATPIIYNANSSHSGTYSVEVVGNNGCSKTEDIQVTVQAPITITASNNGPVCEGDTLRLSVTNGASYSWTGPNNFTSNLQNPAIPNATMNHYGQYKVTVVSQSGCTATAKTNAAITMKPNLNVRSIAPLCSGQVLYLQATGGMSYQWSGPNNFSSNVASPVIGNVTTAMSGTYSVSTQNFYGCKDSGSVLVTINSGTPVTASYNSPLSVGGTLNLTANSTASNFRWSGPNNFLSASQNPSIANVRTTQAGTYTVTVTDAEGCKESATVSVNVLPSPPPTQPLAIENNLKIYPNPAQNRVTISTELKEPLETIIVYNALGQIIFKGNAEGYTTYQLNVGDYVSGIYQTKVILHNGQQLSRKFEVAK